MKTTPLFAEHQAAGARLVPFAGFKMPISYGGGIKEEHQIVRRAAGLFDVSHMGEVDFRGRTALDTVQKLITNDASRLEDHQALYTALCNPDGGIVDDCIVYRLAGDFFRIVINASNIDKDLEHFQTHGGGCEMFDRSDEIALLAVQGPQAVELVARLGGAALADVPRFGIGEGRCGDHAFTAARTGYTGEDGFELFLDGAAAPDVWRALVEAGATPIGLGARDTLRLEAALLLYGNDIDETTSPLEAGIGWAVKLDKGADFVGREALVRQKQDGLRRRLVGFRVDGPRIARGGAEILDGAGEVVGQVTSGSIAPTAGGVIGLGYVPTGMSKVGTALKLRQSGRELDATVVKRPFYRAEAG